MSISELREARTDGPNALAASRSEGPNNAQPEGWFEEPHVKHAQREAWAAGPSASPSTQTQSLPDAFLFFPQFDANN